MTSSTTLRSAACLLASLALAACNGTTTTDGGADALAESGTDAGTPTDTRTDTGSPTDVVDSGTPDAGLHDSGPADTGTPDAGPSLDAGNSEGGTDSSVVTDVVAPTDTSITDVVPLPDASIADVVTTDVPLADVVIGTDATTPVYSFASPLQVNLRSIFNVDTVANTSATGESYRPLGPLVAMDGSGYDFLTESVAMAAGDMPASGANAGLPDDGYFASDTNHPNVQLAFSNTTVTPNSVILNIPASGTTPAGPTSVTFPITPAHFANLQLYMTSTEGASTVTVTLTYSDATTTTTPGITVPDWFQAGTASPPVFVVQQGLSRYSSAGDDFSDIPALYGAGVIANPLKTLTSVTLAVIPATGVMNRVVFYGATAY